MKDFKIKDKRSIRLRRKIRKKRTRVSEVQEEKKTNKKEPFMNFVFS